MTDQPMSEASPFPLASGRTKGYSPAAVDAFLARARDAFESDDETDVDAGVIRTVAFPLVTRGYQVLSVDAALGRVEDAFAARERERALARAGARAWVSQSRQLGQEILDRLTRPRGHRFSRTGPLRYGYRIDEVDLVADRIAGFLETGEAVSVEQIRTVAFRMQRRGYSEAQVDAVLDAIVEVMLAVV
ncbi:DivIVA domain-containing protein [Microbacterium sp.]|uniref:DivIVA domain-containing protein n=1 Tax=Microbacterium sp. TaxID=51671 RepID=UPI0025E5306B|nr:DivIVA domain-containing protein [Microbacterium sp.]